MSTTNKLTARYQIEVSALGYDTTTFEVEAMSLAEVKRSTCKAVDAWLTHNDVDGTTRGLAHVRYSLLS